MSKEYFWGAKLTKDERVYKWDPESEFQDDEEDEEDDAITHFLFLKQAVLGVKAKEGDRNVVEVETVNFDGEKITQPLFSLRLGLQDSTTLDIGLQPPVTFKLAVGSGPVYLSGQHALDLNEDEDFGADFKDAGGFDGLEGEEEGEEEEEEEEEEEMTFKKGASKSKDAKKAETPVLAAKKETKGPKKGKGDEPEDEDEEEEEEELTVGKGKKRPAPSSKGGAKKLSKFVEEDEDDDDDEDDLDWQMALGDDDDDDEDDDDEDDDEDDEDMEDDDEEEEEEESPEKPPAKKVKGKVNGTAQKAETPKAQQTKGKKELKTYSVEEMKQELIKSPSKPKKEDKFKNFIKSRFRVNEPKKIQELWGWYKGTQLK